jgi:prophage regulatory protein
MDDMKRFLRIKEASRITGVPRSSLYELMRDDPTFPKLVKLNKRTKAFVEEELAEWIEQRIAERDSKRAA